MPLRNRLTAGDRLAVRFCNRFRRAVAASRFTARPHPTIKAAPKGVHPPRAHWLKIGWPEPRSGSPAPVEGIAPGQGAFTRSPTEATELIVYTTIFPFLFREIQLFTRPVTIRNQRGWPYAVQRNTRPFQERRTTREALAGPARHSNLTRNHPRRPFGPMCRTSERHR